MEAARAGDAGRGIRECSVGSPQPGAAFSQAAKDIKDLIGSSSGQVQEGVELVNRAGNSLGEIVTSIQQVADIVSGIASASGEQSFGIDQVNKALAQIGRGDAAKLRAVEENAATSKTLEQQSQLLDQLVGFFRIDSARQTAATALRHAFVSACHKKTRCDVASRPDQWTPFLKADCKSAAAARRSPPCSVVLPPALNSATSSRARSSPASGAG